MARDERRANSAAGQGQEFKLAQREAGTSAPKRATKSLRPSPTNSDPAGRAVRAPRGEEVFEASATRPQRLGEPKKNAGGWDDRLANDGESCRETVVYHLPGRAPS